MKNTENKKRRDRIARIGCIVCYLHGHPGTPAEIHHIRRNGGKRDASPEIALCPIHHRNGGRGIAVHAGRKSFEEFWGLTEYDLLAKTEMLLSKEEP